MHFSLFCQESLRDEHIEVPCGKVLENYLSQGRDIAPQDYSCIGIILNDLYAMFYKKNNSWWLDITDSTMGMMKIDVARIFLKRSKHLREISDPYVTKNQLSNAVLLLD